MNSIREAVERVIWRHSILAEVESLANQNEADLYRMNDEIDHLIMTVVSMKRLEKAKQLMNSLALGFPEPCGLCGQRHHGKCDPDLFLYFVCRNCNQPQDMPKDCAGYVGSEGMYCGCGVSTKWWMQISYQVWLEISHEDHPITRH